jgi:hypothetical protein
MVKTTKVVWILVGASHSQVALMACQSTLSENEAQKFL